MNKGNISTINNSKEIIKLQEAEKFKSKGRSCFSGAERKAIVREKLRSACYQ